MAKGEKSKGQKPKAQAKSTRQATKRAAIYIESFHHLPQEYVARFGEPKVTPLDVQERACRAYCERMGYAIFSVYTATKPPPENVKLQWVLSARLNPSSPDTSTEWRLLHLYDSRHPFYWVRNLLEEASVDVVVEFRESGSSGPMFPELVETLGTSQGHLAQFEYASLWEINPPTEKERLRYELMERIGDVNSEDEMKSLAEQVKRLPAEIKREAQEAEGRAKKEHEEALTEAQPQRYQVVIDWDDDAQTYLAHVPELPGCIAHGATFEEAAREVQVAIRLWQDVAAATKSNEC